MVWEHTTMHFRWVTSVLILKFENRLFLNKLVSEDPFKDRDWFSICCLHTVAVIKKLHSLIWPSSTLGCRILLRFGERLQDVCTAFRCDFFGPKPSEVGERSNWTEGPAWKKWYICKCQLDQQLCYMKTVIREPFWRGVTAIFHVSLHA